MSALVSNKEYYNITFPLKNVVVRLTALQGPAYRARPLNVIALG